MTANASPLPYRLRWAAPGARPGAHRGAVAGAGGSLKGFAPLARANDPRRIDLRLSARDPFENLYVREFEQKSAITVYALVDVSGSMSFEGSARKMHLTAELCATLAASAKSAGDAFGMIGCDDQIREELMLPATRLRGIEREIFIRLLQFKPQARDASALPEAARYFAGRRKLVFVISDFLMPLPQTEALFQSLAQHDVAPIVIRDPAQDSDIPRWGFMEARDLETGRTRLLFMRPKLREAWLRKAEEHHAQLVRLCGRYGRRPFIVEGQLDPLALGAYLMEG
jgi:uncharacterized protein (DUF58 family)